MLEEKMEKSKQEAKMQFYKKSFEVFNEVQDAMRDLCIKMNKLKSDDSKEVFNQLIKLYNNLVDLSNTNSGFIKLVNTKEKKELRVELCVFDKNILKKATDTVESIILRTNGDKKHDLVILAKEIDAFLIAMKLLAENGKKVAKEVQAIVIEQNAIPDSYLN